jgi:hypothetical protein
MRPKKGDQKKVARTTEITRVVGNRGRAFGSSRSYKRKSSHHGTRSNTGGEILAYNLATGNPGARKDSMAKTRKKSYHKRPGSKRKSYKKNTGMMKHNRSHSHSTKRRYPKRRNAGDSIGSVGGLVTTGTFAIVGALGSKLGAQLVLGSSNTGPIGYLANAGVGAGMWFLADKVMKNRNMGHGILIGTVIQIILRVVNDYTPFGTYVANLGMGDYQVQSFVQPQILIDPVNSAAISIPNGWGAPAISAPAMSAGHGMKGYSPYDGFAASSY